LKLNPRSQSARDGSRNVVSKIREKPASLVTVRRLLTAAGGLGDASLSGHVLSGPRGGPNDSNFNLNTCA
jgi:hypothetical protein